MKAITRICLWAAMLLAGANAMAQEPSQLLSIDKKELLQTLRLEMRADFSAISPFADRSSFNGKYFNLHMGGNLGGGFSYYLRQRIVADAGSSVFFDNTDFLYLNYKADQHWSFRFGKDALAVGGFEYDAPPIDIFYTGYYWNNFPCFLLGASTAWTSSDGQHTLRFQIANTPYRHITGVDTHHGRFAYNLLWNGHIGPVQTLYSFGALTRNDGQLYLLALGTKVEYPRWSAYVDFLSHTGDLGDLGKTSNLIAEVNFKLNPVWTLFCKGSYSFNESDDWMYEPMAYDFLSQWEQMEYYVGVGVTCRPAFCPDVRLHAFLSRYYLEADADGSGLNTLLDYYHINIGATWNVNVAKALHKN